MEKCPANGDRIMAGAPPIGSLRKPMRMQQITVAVIHVTIKWKEGLHLPQAMILVNTAGRYKSKITIEVPSMGSLCLQNERDITRLKSGSHQHFDGVSSTVALGAIRGTGMIVRVKGPDADEAATEIAKIFRMTEKEIQKEYKRMEGGKR